MFSKSAIPSGVVQVETGLDAKALAKQFIKTQKTPAEYKALAKQHMQEADEGKRPIYVRSDQCRVTLEFDGESLLCDKFEGGECIDGEACPVYVYRLRKSDDAEMIARLCEFSGSGKQAQVVWQWLTHNRKPTGIPLVYTGCLHEVRTQSYNPRFSEETFLTCKIGRGRGSVSLTAQK